eukprot:SAG31_NODE_6172_length_2137_cov_2.024031_3_plen_163_part_01
MRRGTARTGADGRRGLSEQWRRAGRLCCDCAETVLRLCCDCGACGRGGRLRTTSGPHSASYAWSCAACGLAPSERMASPSELTSILVWALASVAKILNPSSSFFAWTHDDGAPERVSSEMPKGVGGGAKVRSSSGRRRGRTGAPSSWRQTWRRGCRAWGGRRG